MFIKIVITVVFFLFFFFMPMVFKPQETSGESICIPVTLFEDGSIKTKNGEFQCLIPEWGCDE